MLTDITRAIGFMDFNPPTATVQFASGKIIELRRDVRNEWYVDHYAGCEEHAKCNRWSCVWMFGVTDKWIWPIY